MSTLQTVQLPSTEAWGVSIGGSRLLRTPPEPRNSGMGWMNTAASAVSSVAQTALGVGGFGGSSDITNLLNQQIQIQQVMQTVTMVSNVARSQHETEMAPIRNMRVG